MSDNLNNCIIVGTGEIAKEYCRVLKELDVRHIVVGRDVKKAKIFGRENEVNAVGGGIEEFLRNTKCSFTNAIVATDILSLCTVTCELIKAGVKNILVEKPAGINRKEIDKIAHLADIKASNVFVAYNRRFYASTDKVLEYVKKDGGVKSFCFEFTEWSNTIECLDTDIRIKEAWFLANSTHVVDLAFFIGGEPQVMNCYNKGSLNWHKRGCIYSGAGITERDAIFSYHANWAAPGRWSVEILTDKHRLYLKPMEKLAVQELNSVQVVPVEINDELDQKFKPGFYKEVESFIKGYEDGKKKTIHDQLRYMDYYEKIEKQDRL